jgi:hypothetical protein
MKFMLKVLFEKDINLAWFFGMAVVAVLLSQSMWYILLTVPVLVISELGAKLYENGEDK